MSVLIFNLTKCMKTVRKLNMKHFQFFFTGRLSYLSLLVRTLQHTFMYPTISRQQLVNRANRFRVDLFAKR